MIRQYRIYMKHMRHSARKFILHCLLSLISLIGSIATVFMLSALIDDASSNHMDSFKSRIWVTLVVIAVSITADYLSNRLLLRLQSQLGESLRYRMQYHQLHAKIAMTNTKDSGKILTTYKEQTDTAIDFMKNLQGYVLYPLTILLASIYFISIDIRLFAASVVLMPLSSIIYSKLSAPIQQKRKEIMESKAKLTEQINDVMSGFMTMKAGCQEAYFIGRYQEQMDQILKKEKEVERINATLGRIFILIRYIPQLIIPLFGGYLAFKQSISLGQLTAAGMIAGYIFNPVQMLLGMKKEERILAPAIADINEILDLEQEDSPEILETNQEGSSASDIAPNVTQASKLPNPSDQKDTVISLNDLSFAYEAGKPVLSHISLEVKQNDHVVLIGESGSGKSTLIKAICGILSGYQGEVCLKQQLMTSANQPQLRSLISYIPQTIYLFHGTILENIAMKQTYSKEEVIRAAKLAQADEFIQNLTDGYETVVGDGGLSLSGGQMQRLAIARGIFRNCELFILDEPTAAVDEQNSQAIMEGLRTVLKDRSSIIITHRMDVIDKDDRVLRLNGGTLYEA